MTVKLNRATFKRLVQFYLVAVVASVGVGIFELLVWYDFSNEFDQLTARHFGEPTDRDWIVFGVLALPAFIAHVVAVANLLKFRRWARMLTWVSLIIMMAPAAIPALSFYWGSIGTLWLDVIAGGLFGMILLLAYSSDHGAIWFAQRELKETE